ncbi:MAG: hypothetical protein M1823_001929 [Watsoniomyces obsoletus]|nr:MAG: hypothetical protein M1823_001929 [Watsoniomyces obsoletus]
MDEVVTAFKSARSTALLFAREARDGLEKNAQRSKKRKLEQLSQDDSTDQRRKTRSQSRREISTQASSPATEVDDEVQEVSDGLVACPLCGRRMEEARVYSHLDNCEEEKKRGLKPSVGLADAPYGHMLYPQLQQAIDRAYRANRRSLPIPLKPATPPQMERLPKLNYSLYKEGALKKKLSELGIRSNGSKAMLEKRHTEWVNLWNASQDSSKPRTRRELLHELEIWERTQGTLAPTSSGSGSTLMRKDFDGAAWAASHNDDFKKLIASARQRRGVPATKEADAEVNGLTEKPESGGRLENQKAVDGLDDLEFIGEQPAVQEGHSRLVLLGDGANRSMPEVDTDGPEVADSDADAADMAPDTTETAGIPVGLHQLPSITTPEEATLPSPIAPKFLSPAKPRMFPDVDDPIVDADTSMSVK